MHIGPLHDLMVDMWMWDGRFVPDQTAAAGEFVALARTLDAKTVLADLAKGTRIELRETTSQGANAIHCVALQLFDDDRLLLRHVFRQDLIDWVIANVK
jgi:hypothetical protein